MTANQHPLRKAATIVRRARLRCSRVDAHEHPHGESVKWLERRGRTMRHDELGLSPHPAASDLAESVKPREISAAEREAQIVALWRDRPPARRGPEHVAEVFQWLSDYTPWLVPPGEQPLDKITAIVRPHMNGG